MTAICDDRGRGESRLLGWEQEAVRAAGQPRAQALPWQSISVRSLLGYNSAAAEACNVHPFESLGFLPHDMLARLPSFLRLLTCLLSATVPRPWPPIQSCLCSLTRARTLT
jgi:hypothetical protein